MGAVKLTRREQEIMDLLYAGTPKKKVATILGIEYGSVLTRIYTAKARMGAKTSLHAMAMFTREKVKDEI